MTEVRRQVLDRFKNRKKFLPAETSLFEDRSHRPLRKRFSIGNYDKPLAIATMVV